MIAIPSGPGEIQMRDKKKADVQGRLQFPVALVTRQVEPELE